MKSPFLCLFGFDQFVIGKQKFKRDYQKSIKHASKKPAWLEAAGRGLDQLGDIHFTNSACR
jgi:hypothetical protein